MSRRRTRRLWSTPGLTTVTLPASASLDGTVTDDGLPQPARLTPPAGRRSPGPGTVTFGDAAAVDTTATFRDAGTYVLRLTGDDGALSSSDDVTVTVGPGQPGPRRSTPGRTHGHPARLREPGRHRDRRRPAPRGPLTTAGRRSAEPGTVSFGDPAAVDTTAASRTAGTYVLRLNADDGALTGSDDITVTVTAPTRPPSSGRSRRDGDPARDREPGRHRDRRRAAPTAGAVTTTWTQVQRTGHGHLRRRPAVDTSASFSAAGTYVLRLTADDGALTSTTSSRSPSGPPNQAPTVSAGTDQTITLPGRAQRSTAR